MATDSIVPRISSSTGKALGAWSGMSTKVPVGQCRLCFVSGFGGRSIGMWPACSTGWHSNGSPAVAQWCQTDSSHVLSHSGAAPCAGDTELDGICEVGESGSRHAREVWGGIALPPRPCTVSL